MAINIKISKRYSIDKLKFRLKIDNKFFNSKKYYK